MADWLFCVLQARMPWLNGVRLRFWPLMSMLPCERKVKRPTTSESETAIVVPGPLQYTPSGLESVMYTSWLPSSEPKSHAGGLKLLSVPGQPDLAATCAGEPGV